jgi:hypothetical protein
MTNLKPASRTWRPTSHLCEAAAMLALSAMPLRGFAAGQTPTQPPPTDRVAVFTDYDLPPSTLDAAWSAVPIVVLARIQSSAVRERVTRQHHRVPFTEHQVMVVEVFKGAELIGAAKTLIVNQSTVEKGAAPTTVTHESGGRSFRASEEYVLFLERLPVRAALGIAWGSGGAYKVGATAVEVPGASQKMWGHRDEITRQELVTTLRAKRDKSHGKK